MNTHQSLFFAFISIMHSKLLHNPCGSTADWLLLFYLRRLLQQCISPFFSFEPSQHYTIANYQGAFYQHPISS